MADAAPKQIWGKLEDGFDHWDEYKGDGGKGRSVGSGQQARHVVQVMTGFLKSHQAGSTLVDAPQ